MVAPAWRDLQQRFSSVGNRILLPLRVGLVANKDDERASWYRIYVVHNPDQEAALQLCADMQSKQQRCRIMLVRQQVGNDQQKQRRSPPVLVEMDSAALLSESLKSSTH
jgi:hypothetical protein